ncbi:universal stress protein, partial [Tenacibaculum sp.]|nr:universal stress protein [Tenacibaculum sp.]
MKKILLPTDFSENSWNAIEYALNFHKNVVCNFYLLHVSKPTNIITHQTNYIKNQVVAENISLKNKFKKLLNLIATKTLINKKHSFYTLIEHDSLISSIRNQVEKKKIDMIVMGTKGATGLKEFIIGSNSGDVITKVACTTLIVPEKASYKTLTEIALPTDYVLSYKIQLLKPIAKILEKTNSSLRIVHVNKKDSYLNADQQINKNLLENFFKPFTHSFHSLTNRKVEDAIDCFVQSR